MHGSERADPEGIASPTGLTAETYHLLNIINSWIEMGYVFITKYLSFKILFVKL